MTTICYVGTALIVLAFGTVGAVALIGRSIVQMIDDQIGCRD